MAGRLILHVALLGAAVLAVAGALDAPAADATAVASAASVPRPDHVVVVVEENKAATQIIGSPDAPFITSLAQNNANFTQSYAITHPSQPNYLALFSGSTQGVTDDNCPYTFTTDNLGTSLIAAGDTFTGYSESLPSAGYTGCSSGEYVRKHNPWVDFPAIPASANQPFTAFPTDYSQLPAVSFVIPNLLDDMHDGTIAQGDTWLQQNLGGYITWAKTHNSLFVLTFDEDDGSSANNIATVFAGQQVVPGTYSEQINHYSVLRTICDAFGIAAPANAATASPILDVWTAQPGGAVFDSDTFARTVTNGWGSADVGGAYTLSGTSANFAVSGGAGTMRLPRPGTQDRAALLSATATDAELLTSFALDKVPTGGQLYLSIFGRTVSAGNEYGVRLRLQPSGSVTLGFSRYVGGAETVIAPAVVVPGLTYAAGTSISLRLQVSGTNPTVLRARAWPSSGAEPTTWTETATDSTAALQVAGGIAFVPYLSSAATNAPVTVAVTSLTATHLNAVTDQPPTAAFTSSCTQLACSFDASGSTDADGTITSYGWTFGDGSTGSGITPSHTFGGAGSYQVTLTVTDGGGATASVTQAVTVSATTAPFASDQFDRTISTGWGTADVGGTWSVTPSSSNLSVSGGAGLINLTAPGMQRTARLPATAGGADLTTSLAANRLPVGGPVYLWVFGRSVSTGTYYALRLTIYPTGSVNANLTGMVGGTETQLTREAPLPGVTYAPGAQLMIHMQVTGDAPTTVRARVWPAGAAEPTSWPLSATDSTAALQAAGGVGIQAYLSSKATNAPVLVSVGPLTATAA